MADITGRALIGTPTKARDDIDFDRNFLQWRSIELNSCTNVMRDSGRASQGDGLTFSDASCATTF
jgi:hypothetical protein